MSDSTVFRSWTLRLLVLAALVAGVYFAYRAAGQEESRVARVQRGTAVSAVSASVSVHAEDEQQLKSEVGGRVESSRLRIGNRYAKGDELLQIDTGDLKLEIERIESEFATAKQRIAVGSAIELELKSAQEHLANVERLAQLGNVSDADLTRARRGLQAIEQRKALEQVGNDATLAAFENTLQVKRRQLEKMTVRAPFDCVVAELHTRPGDLIGAGSPLARLISVSRKVEARIAEEFFSAVKVGQAATVRFNGYGADVFTAKVTQILPTADQATQRYVVYLEVDLDPVRLVPGLTGDASVLLAERPNALILPRRAVVNGNLLLVRGGRVEARTVQVGFVALNAVEVLDGVEEGDLVIVDEIERFREGDRVRPVLVEQP